jgi:predicted nucleic acid-binding protein
MTVVTDSGPLIVLAKISHLHLLPILYTEVIIPPAVYHEVIVVGQTRGYADAEALQAFFDSRGWQPSEPPRMPPELTGEARLGKGEREAIALAQQHQSLLLVDEVYARSAAARMGIETVGSLGILVEAYRKSNMTPGVFEELLRTMERREDIWIHPDLCRRVRREILGK